MKINKDYDWIYTSKQPKSTTKPMNMVLYFGTRSDKHRNKCASIRFNAEVRKFCTTKDPKTAFCEKDGSILVMFDVDPKSGIPFYTQKVNSIHSIQLCESLIKFFDIKDDNGVAKFSLTPAFNDEYRFFKVEYIGLLG